jgi:hypothetical protein
MKILKPGGFTMTPEAQIWAGVFVCLSSLYLGINEFLDPGPIGAAWFFGPLFLLGVPGGDGMARQSAQEQQILTNTLRNPACVERQSHTIFVYEIK